MPSCRNHGIQHVSNSTTFIYLDLYPLCPGTRSEDGNATLFSETGATASCNPAVTASPPSEAQFSFKNRADNVSAR